MISEEQVTHIRHLFHAEHWKIGTIAAELGLHPDTVRAALDTGRFRSRPRLRDRLTDSYLTSCARPCGPILACAPPLRDDWGGARKASCTSLPGIKIGDLGRKSPEPKIPQRNYLDFLSRAASSLIGYLADESKRLEDLGIRILDPDLEPRDVRGDLDFAAHVTLILKLNQMSQRNLRGLYLREELRSSWSRYRQAVRDELAGLVAAIKGIHYELADIWDIIERSSADDASFFASVPHYADGYRKMFQTPNLAWNEPKIAQFDPKRFIELTRRLGEAKCAALLCRRGEWEEEVPPPWKRVFGRPESREKALWIIANRSVQAYAENHTGFGDIRKLPIYDDHEITPASKFHVTLVGLPTRSITGTCSSTGWGPRPPTVDSCCWSMAR